MTRRRMSMMLDRDLIAEAQEILQTRNMTDTVHAVLVETVRFHEVRLAAASAEWAVDPPEASL